MFGVLLIGVFVGCDLIMYCLFEWCLDLDDCLFIIVCGGLFYF